MEGHFLDKAAMAVVIDAAPTKEIRKCPAIRGIYVEEEATLEAAADRALNKAWWRITDRPVEIASAKSRPPRLPRLGPGFGPANAPKL